jgi:hypothetical protein
LISRIVLVGLMIFGFFVPLVHAASPQAGGDGITILYSADERGEIEPCG